MWIPLMKVDNDIDVEKDMPFVGPSRNYILMKPRSFCLSSRDMENSWECSKIIM